MEVIPNMGKLSVENSSDYDHAKELKIFEETKAGVKGLLDSGINKVPKIFHQPPEYLQMFASNTDGNYSLQIPEIDLKGLENEIRRKEIVNELREAAETWGFFRLVNHGVPVNVMEDVIEGVKRFHEQPMEPKMEIYQRDFMQRVKYTGGGRLNKALAANWKDALQCEYLDQQIDEEEIPQVCRKEISEYVKCMIQLKDTLSELLSEALGLPSDHLASIDCMKSMSFVGNFYPICPEPDLVLGLSNHSDPNFLTILEQDSIGGLQILHQNQWVDVPYVRGSLVVNIADFMQIITNDKFKSVIHRVLLKSVGPRVSIASFFLPSTNKFQSPFGPMKELLSEKNPPIYKEVSFPQYLASYKPKEQNLSSALSHFKL